jgi:hypothetical protein
MHYLAPFLFILFIFSVVSSFATGARRFRKRARRVSDYTLKKGYRLLNPAVQQNVNSSGIDILRSQSLKSFAKGSEGITDIEPFANGTEDPFAIICNLRSKEVSIFNFDVPSRRVDGSGGTIHYKVAKVRCDGLPRFSLGPRSFVHSVENVLQTLTGKPAPTVDADPRMGSDFESHYWLEASDRDAAFSFLRPEKLAFIVREKLKGHIATNSLYIVYWEDGELHGEDDCDSFVGTVEQIVEHLL